MSDNNGDKMDDTRNSSDENQQSSTLPPGNDDTRNSSDENQQSSTLPPGNEKEGKQEKNPENKDDNKSDNTRDNETKIKVITQSKGTMKIVFNIEPEKKPYYNTCSCKRGLLCIVQLVPNWIEENKKDSDVLKEFFEDTLGFHVEKFTSYSALDAAFNPTADTKTKNDPNTKKIVGLENYYCLLICISGHGDEKGVIVDVPPKTNCNETCKNFHDRKTVDDIKTRFGNAKIKTLTGVPKIFILDVCRGGTYNTTEPNDAEDKAPTKQVLPTKSSDFLFIHATTNGHVARIPKGGSVGIQSVVSALKANWENDHLEEMLIDAREIVAQYKGISKDNKEVRQTLETQSTLTKRLMFVASSKKEQDVSQAEPTAEN